MDEKGILSAHTAIPNRRKFFRNLGMAAAGTAVVAATGEKAQAYNSNDQNDVTILSFLLNFKFLLAEFYSVGLTGNTLQQMLVEVNGNGIAGPTTGGKKISDFHSASRIGSMAQIIAEISEDEVDQLYNYFSYIFDYYDYDLIPKPPINLNGWGFGFGSYQEFLILGRMLEDLYISAATYLLEGLNDSTAFDDMTAMVAVDAMHLGNLRAQIASLALRTKPIDCYDFIPPVGPGGQPFVPNSGNTTAPNNPQINGEYFSTIPTLGLSITRNPDQTLYLLYGNAPSAASGGFFPQGITPYPYYSTTSGPDDSCTSRSARPQRFTPRGIPGRSRPAAQARTPRSTVQNHSLIGRSPRSQPGPQKRRGGPIPNVC